MQSIKLLICNKLSELDKKCDKYQLYDKDDEFLVRFKGQYDEVYRWDEEDNHSKLLQKYARAVLDLTFYEETKLTNDDFQAPNAKETMYGIIDNLDGIEKLCLEYTDNPAVLLGEEITECILWRKGALIYMYCATVVEAPEEFLRDSLPHFLQCLHDSVKHLEKMVNVRKPLRVSRDMVERDDDETYFLLSEGIFSSTTMLALAYVGELCYWFCKYYDPAKTAVERKEMVDVGMRFMKRYLRTCEGPLKGKGWNTDKAKDHLSYITACNSA